MKDRTRSDELNRQLLDRMERITGQTRGILRMIEEERYCIDILIQIGAVKGALNQVALQLFEDHSRHCLTSSLAQGGEQQEEAIQELITALKRML